MNVGTVLNAKSHDVVTIKGDATLQAAARTLADHRIGAVLVCDDEGSVTGIISERDIVRLIARDGDACLDAAVTSAMTANPVACAPSDTIQHVMERMTSGRFRHMPVLDGGSLVGIISIGDVVKHHIAEVETEATALKTYLVSG